MDNGITHEIFILKKTKKLHTKPWIKYNEYDTSPSILNIYFINFGYLLNSSL